MMIRLFLSVLFCISTNGYWITIDEDSSNALFDLNLYEKVLDQDLCAKQIRYMASNNTRLLAQFLDAGFRIPRGLFDNNSVDFGNYHQCLEIDSPFEQSRIAGKYCIVQVPSIQNLSIPNFSSKNGSRESDLIKLGLSGRTLLDKYYYLIKGYAEVFYTGLQNTTSSICGTVFKLAICIPRACTTDDAITNLFFNLSAIGLEYGEEYCRLPNDKPWVKADSIALVIFTSIGILTILSTLYEVTYIFILKRVPDSAYFCYRTFSVYNNTRRLLHCQSDSNIKCLEGIKTLAMMWIIIGHSLSSVSYLLNPTYFLAWTLSAESSMLTSVPITADTFFMLGGLLLVYNCACKMDGMTLIRNLHLFYLNRLLRMFPLLATSILLDASVLHKLADGPLYVTAVTAANAQRCRTYWWTTLIHLQTYINPKDMCVPHSWYVALDIQLHILSPIILFWVLSGSRQVAWSALMGGFIVAMAISACYNFIMLLPAHTIIPARNNELWDYFTKYYFHIISRITSFLVGMVVGYILHLWRGKKVEIYTKTVLILWATCFGILLGIVYVLYCVKRPDWDNVFVDAAINTLMRPLWSAAVGWIVLACAHGYGGPIEWFLSLPMWQLPGRISYGLYLFHYPILFVANDVSLSPQYFTLGRILFQSIAFTMLTFILAFVFTVIIDIPFTIIFKKILDKGYRKQRKKYTEELELLKHTD